MLGCQHACTLPRSACNPAVQAVHRQRSQTVAQARSSEQVATTIPRREYLAILASVALAAASPALAQDPHVAVGPDQVQELAMRAINAYNAQELNESYDLYCKCAALDPENPVWCDLRCYPPARLIMLHA